MRRNNRNQQRAALAGFMLFTLAACLLLAGCTSIITHIRSDSRVGTAQCEPETSAGGAGSVRRDCTIHQLNTKPSN